MKLFLPPPRKITSSVERTWNSSGVQIPQVFAGVLFPGELTLPCEKAQVCVIWTQYKDSSQYEIAKWLLRKVVQWNPILHYQLFSLVHLQWVFVGGVVIWLQPFISELRIFLQFPHSINQTVSFMVHSQHFTQDPSLFKVLFEELNKNVNNLIDVQLWQCSCLVF